MDAEPLPIPIPFAYEIAGCVNGAHLSLRISGTVAPREVRFEGGFTSGAGQLLCDEPVLALVGIDPVVLLSLNPAGVQPDAAPETFRVESSILDEGLKAAVTFVLAGCWSIDKGRLALRAQIVEGWLNFEPLERVTHVEKSSSMSLLPADLGTVAATRAWSIGTSRGNGSNTNIGQTVMTRGRRPSGQVMRAWRSGCAPR